MKSLLPELGLNQREYSCLVNPKKKLWPLAIGLGAAVTLSLAGCSSSSTIVGSLTLPTSGLTVDMVQVRTDSKDCPVGWVLQTYDSKGQLIDSKSGGGQSLPCQLVNVSIEAGSRVGAAALIANGLRHSGDSSSTTNNNSNSNSASQSQGQTQLQLQHQGQHQTQTTNYNNPSNPPSEGGGGHNGKGGGNNNGNNGGGNGNNDGTNPGTGHHHNNGDNS